MDCCHQYLKATHGKIITQIWLSKGKYVILLNLPEQIVWFWTLWEYWKDSTEPYIHLIKSKLINMLQTQAYIPSKLTGVHQSNELDWITDGLYPSQQSKIILQNCLFHICDSKEDIIDQLKAGHIVSWCHYPQYPKHVIIAFCKVGVLGLIALQADIGVDEQYESGVYFCRFS